MRRRRATHYAWGVEVSSNENEVSNWANRNLNNEFGYLIKFLFFFLLWFFLFFVFCDMIKENIEILSFIFIIEDALSLSLSLSLYIYIYIYHSLHTHTHIHTHTCILTHTYIYIYIYVCVCVYVCVYIIVFKIYRENCFESVKYSDPSTKTYDNIPIFHL